MPKLYYINSEISIASIKWLLKEGLLGSNSLVLFSDSIKHIVPKDSKQFLNINLFEGINTRLRYPSKLMFFAPAGNINETFKDFRRLESLGYIIEIIPQFDKWHGNDLAKQTTSVFNSVNIIKYPKYKTKYDLLARFYYNKSALITGAGGSIGSELIKQMLKLGFKELILLDNSEYNLYKLKEEIDFSAEIELHFILGDIRNQNKIRRLFEDYSIDIVFHLAAYKHVHLMNENPDEAFEVNVLGTKIIFDIAIDYKCDNFIFISTDKAVDPTTVMGCTKKIASDYVLSNSLESKTQVSIVRFGNILQSNGSVVDKFYHQIKSQDKITLTEPRMQRYFMLIEDVARFILDVGYSSYNRKHLVFDIKEPTKLSDLIEALIVLSGLPKQTKPCIQKNKIVTAGEKLNETLYSAGENLELLENGQIKLITPTIIDSKLLDKEISRITKIVKSQNWNLSLHDLTELTNLSDRSQQVV